MHLYVAVRARPHLGLSVTSYACVLPCLQFEPAVIADMMTWLTGNGLEAFDVKPFLVGGANARIVPDTRDKTMTRPPTTDTELEKVRSLAYNPAGGKQVDIWIPVCDGAKLPTGIYPKSLTHAKAKVQRMLDAQSVYNKFMNWILKVCSRPL